MSPQYSANRVAVVTGSGKRRVGSHVIDALAARGYNVVIHYRTSGNDAEATAKRLGNAIAVKADLASEDDVSHMAATVLDTFGRVDVLVNCAAIWPRKKLEDTTAADVRECFDINTLGTFLTCQHFGLQMVKQPEGGSIINFGDWADARPYPDYAAYFPSKAAIPGLTRMFAMELGTRNPNVRVNAILPGPVMLPADLPADEKAEAIAGTLVSREGTPEHIVKAVLHFLDNDFLTGVCLPVDGGRSIYAHGQ
ncbi:SDR family oxidoreductase [soil metagenome]